MSSLRRVEINSPEGLYQGGSKQSVRSLTYKRARAVVSGAGKPLEGGWGGLLGQKGNPGRGRGSGGSMSSARWPPDPLEAEPRKEHRQTKGN